MHKYHLFLIVGLLSFFGNLNSAPTGNSEPPSQLAQLMAKHELENQYQIHCSRNSDIHEHLPHLRRLAKECSSVVEMGLRSMVSTWGILQGLAESPYASRSYLGIDISSPPLPSLHLAHRLTNQLGIAFQFWQINDLKAEIEVTDMLFIDTLHTYCQLTCELEKFSPYVRKYIAMHDTSDPWGTRDDSDYRGDYSEYPPHISRSKRGLWLAVEDFLSAHPEWSLSERHFNNHGFTVLKRNTDPYLENPDL